MHQWECIRTLAEHSGDVLCLCTCYLPSLAAASASTYLAPGASADLSAAGLAGGGTAGTAGPAAKWLLSGSSDGSIKVIRPGSWHCERTLAEGAAPVVSLKSVTSASGCKLVAATTDGCASIYSIPSWICERVLPGPVSADRHSRGQGPCGLLAVEVLGQRIYCGDEQGSLVVFEG